MHESIRGLCRSFTYRFPAVQAKARPGVNITAMILGDWAIVTLPGMSSRSLKIAIGIGCAIK